VSGTALSVLPIDTDTVRLFLHLLAAAVWVGGQVVLAALVPALKRVSADAPRAAARQFNRVAWPAYAVLVVTGVWNIAAVGDSMGSAYRTTLTLKLVVVVLSGLTAFAHARATTRRGLAVFGALTGLTALLALFLGVLLDS
jgi:putative copper export protein